MRTSAAIACLALVASACKTTTATSTSVSGAPRLEPAPAAVAAPAPAPPAAAYSPAGKWTIGIIAGGQNMEVSLELVKLADGTWTGSIGTAQFGTIPLSKVEVTGKKMIATFPVPTGDMGSMTLNFDGDNAEGEWSMPGDGSKVAGKRG
jgi:hypothetical protein